MSMVPNSCLGCNPDINSGPRAALPGLPGLLHHHLAELRASGLSDEMIAQAKVYSETDATKIGKLVGWAKAKKTFAPALVIPFPGANGFGRVKPDQLITLGGKRAKYLSPKGQPNRLYLPPGVAEVLGRNGIDLFITEGEKKALKATQDGFPCIGLIGVYGWKSGKAEGLLADFTQIALQGRRVYIVFDSDAASNPDVHLAESHLARLLQQRGADVGIVRLPEGPIGLDGKAKKQGFDDYLVAHGAEEFARLVETAIAPDLPATADLKIHAKDLDPAVEAQAFIESGAIAGVPTLCSWHGAFWRWNGACFAESRDGEVRAKLMRFLNGHFFKVVRSVTDNVLDQLKTLSMLDEEVEQPSWLGQSPLAWAAEEVLCARNGLLHIPSLIRSEPCFVPPTPRFFNSTALNFDVVLDAPPPVNWLRFLEDLWPGDHQSVSTLQEWIGYLLTADTSQQKILLLIGPPRSGKGTIARILRDLLGHSNVASPTLASMVSNFGLAPLIGKSLAIIADARLGRHTDQAAVVERLLSISGEDAHTIDRKYREPVTCKLPTRVMILSNVLPKLLDSSGAIAHRMIVLRLTESFLGREDTALTDKLRQELAGILLWAVAGWQRLRERGHFEQPASADALVEQLHDLTSPIDAFIGQCCVKGAAQSVRKTDLYSRWCSWCRVVGREPGTAGSFGCELHAAVSGLGRSQPREEGGRADFHVGIGLR